MVKRKKQLPKKSKIKGRKPSNKSKDSKVRKLIKLAKIKKSKNKKGTVYLSSGLYIN